MGVNVLLELVRQAGAMLGEDFDVEIIERHHSKKVDAPSGTCLLYTSGICFAECGKTPFIQCGADAGGQLIIKPEIMQDSQLSLIHI